MKIRINLIALSLLICGFSFAQNRKGAFHLQPGSSSHRLYVAFKSDITDGQDSRQAIITAVPELAKLMDEYSIVPAKAIQISDSKLQELEAVAVKNTGSGKSVARLRNIYELTIANPDNNTLLKLAGELEKLESVEYCSLISSDPVKPPFDIAPITPAFENQQTYITDFGVNMTYAWDMGLTAEGMNLRDVEYGFNGNHEELNDVTAYIGPGMTISDDATPDFTEHGTAVFGIIYANKGNYGITGMANGATEIVLFPEYQQSGYNRVTAVTHAIAYSSEGDLIVYEMQTFGPSNQYCPAEYENVIWDLTKAATDAGIVVVAAAGNGDQNLDTTPYLPYMQRGDSGAIIVGAGSNDATHERLGFSTCGTRVDVQGWGQGVFSSGYGDAAQIGGDFDQNYTNFSGTSSATPIVASCVAVLQSYYHSLTGEYMTGQQMRQLLIETGTPQGPVVPGNIGPLPNMETAITAISGMMGTPDVQGASFSVYPNPVQDKLTITADGFSGTATTEVYNSLGQLVNSISVSDGTQLDFSSMSKGIYIVKVTDGDKTATKKVIKK